MTERSVPGRDDAQSCVAQPHLAKAKTNRIAPTTKRRSLPCTAMTIPVAKTAAMTNHARTAT
jgi:hypothetical protein